MQHKNNPPKGVKFYWELFITFFRIGSFTIGGGYVMIPLIQEEIVEKKGWIDKESFIDLLALAQSAPGVLAVNTAIFIGYKLKGIRGSLITTMGSALPSFLIILLIALFFADFREYPIVERIFKGIRPAVVALIASPLYKMTKSARITYRNIWIPIAVALIVWQTSISPIWIILVAITGGVAYGIRKNRNSQKTV